MKLRIDGCRPFHSPRSLEIHTSGGVEVFDGDDTVLSIILGQVVFVQRAIARDKKILETIEKIIPWHTIQFIRFSTEEPEEEVWSRLVTGVNPPLCPPSLPPLFEPEPPRTDLN
jgi:hypothetical protein